MKTPEAYPTRDEKIAGLESVIVYVANVLMHPHCERVNTVKERESLAAGAMRRAVRIAAIRNGGAA